MVLVMYIRTERCNYCEKRRFLKFWRASLATFRVTRGKVTVLWSQGWKMASLAVILLSLSVTRSLETRSLA